MTTVIPQQFEVKQDGTGGIGHNSRNADPGSATDLVLAGPLFLRQANVDRDALNEFCAAIRSQGNDAVRHRAIDNALVRHRANPAISNLGYRVLSAIAWVSHGKYRYHGMPMEALALFAGQASATNMGRILKGLGLADAVTCIAVPREKGGRPMNFIALRCTAEDRTGAAVADLKQQARERYDGIARAKRDGFEWAELVQEPTRHHDELTEADTEISASSPSTNSSPGRIATRHHDDQSADSRLQREEENDGDSPCTISGAEENIAAANAGDLSDPPQHGNAELGIAPPRSTCNDGLVPQAIKDRYFVCAKDWGFRYNDPRRGLVELDRGESDRSCLGQLIPYRDRPPNIVLMAMEVTMRDVELKRAAEAALAPSAQTTFAGLSAFAKYFRKGMGGNVRTLSEQEAQAIADRAVHEARLSKRMSGVEKGGAGAARQRGGKFTMGSVLDDVFERP